MKGIKTTEFQLVHELPNEQYHQEKEHISCSRLKRMELSPLNFITEPEYKQTTSFDIGNAFECILIEPHLFESQFVVFDPANRPEKEKGMTSKINKEWKAALSAGRTVLSVEQHEQLSLMLANALNNDVLQELLTGGTVQPSVFFEMCGVKFKTRPDFVRGNGVVIDIKTTSAESPEEFARHIYNYKYHWQAYTQCEGWRATGQPVKAHCWIIVQSKAPYDCWVRFCGSETMELAKYQVEAALEQVKECREKNEYPGIPSKDSNGSPISIDVPAWAFK